MLAEQRHGERQGQARPQLIDFIDLYFAMFNDPFIDIEEYNIDIYFFEVFEAGWRTGN